MSVVLDTSPIPSLPHRNGHQPRSGSDELPEDALFEIIDGKRVEKAMSVYANLMAGILFSQLDRFADESRVGRACIEIMFTLPKLDRERRPDVAFVLYQTWPEANEIPSGDSWPFAPDLAVEVISPSNQWEAVLAKIREYFQAGGKLVWVISPRERQIYVYRTTTDVTVLTESDILTGGDLLPGFQVSIAEIFRKAGREKID